MKPLSQIPISCPRRNKQGQPTPGRLRKWALMTQRRREMQKQDFLNLIRLGHTDEQAAAELALPRETPERAVARFGRYWKADPEFQQRYGEACEIFKQVAGGILDMALPKAAAGLVEIGEKAIDPKVQLQAYGMILKGRGVLTEHQEITGEVPTNPGRVLIVNIIGNPEARQAAITLARAVESGTRSDSREAEPGTVEEV